MNNISKIKSDRPAGKLNVSGQGMDRRVEKTTTPLKYIKFAIAVVIVAGIGYWLFDTLAQGRSLSGPRSTRQKSAWMR